MVFFMPEPLRQHFFCAFLLIPLYRHIMVTTMVLPITPIPTIPAQRQPTIIVTAMRRIFIQTAPVLIRIPAGIPLIITMASLLIAPIAQSAVILLKAALPL